MRSAISSSFFSSSGTMRTPVFTRLMPGSVERGTFVVNMWYRIDVMCWCGTLAPHSSGGAMASLFRIGDTFKVQFTFNGKRCTLAVGAHRPAAEAMQGKIERLVSLAVAGEKPEGELR